ncbi:MAG: carbohydrate binding domain-containing protein, partial [Anaerolineae bacterium]
MISRIISGLVLSFSLGLALFMGVYASDAPARTGAAASGIQSQLVIDDFESGLPAGWFQYGDYGSGTAITTAPVVADDIPGLPAGNHALEIAYTSAGWGAGTGRDLDGQDWSSYDGMAFWFYGAGSGATYRIILSDNLNPNVPGDTAERFAYEFDDVSPGWQLISIPWADFFRDYAFQPPDAPNDGLTLTEMQAYALALPAGSRVAKLDQVALFGEGEVEIKVAYASAAYQTAEGSSAVISVTLNAAAAVPVTVTYATADGTALAGTDYTATTGQLLFAPGSTLETFSVAALDNAYDDDERTVLLSLSHPVNAILGPRSSATLTITDDEVSIPAGCRSVIVDNFQDSQLLAGIDPNGLGVGFVTWNATGASVAITTTTAPPAPVPGAAAGNRV